MRGGPGSRLGMYRLRSQFLTLQVNQQPALLLLSHLSVSLYKQHYYPMIFPTITFIASYFLFWIPIPAILQQCNHSTRLQHSASCCHRVCFKLGGAFPRFRHSLMFRLHSLFSKFHELRKQYYHLSFITLSNRITYYV